MAFPRTVQKHMAYLCRKIGVRDRLVPGCSCRSGARGAGMSRAGAASA